MTDSQEKSEAEKPIPSSTENTSTANKHPFFSWARFKHFFIHTVLHADDSPHRIAFGFALGLTLALTPTVGVQVILGICLAWVFRANQAVTHALIWVSNPITTAPIYLFGYWLGASLLGYHFDDGLIMKMLGFHKEGSEWVSSNLGFIEFFQNLWLVMADILVPLWVGCCIMAFAFGIPSYFIVHRMIVKYRMKKYGSIYIHMEEDHMVPTDQAGHDLPIDETGHAILQEEDNAEQAEKAANEDGQAQALEEGIASPTKDQSTARSSNDNSSTEETPTTIK